MEDYKASINGVEENVRGGTEGSQGSGMKYPEHNQKENGLYKSG